MGSRRFISGIGLVGLMAVSPGCRDADGGADGGELPVMELDGEPCDVEAQIGLSDGCVPCVCQDDGRWQCYRTSCAENRMITPNAEVLVVVDDSSSMGPDRQARLARGMRSFVETIEAHGDPVDLRVGVTTTTHSHPACATEDTNDGALLLRSCREHLEDFAASTDREVSIPDDADERGCLSVCDVPRLDARATTVDGDPDGETRPRPWLDHYGENDNIDGDIPFADVLACAIPQGLHGCDFESPLQAAVSALERTLDPEDPAAGFLRPQGSLTVLLVTDEADCSAVEEWGTVFDPEGTRRFWSDPDADAPTSAVCWNTGVVCEGGPGLYDSCTATNIDTAEHEGAPEEHAVLVPAGRYAHLLQDFADVKDTADPYAEIELAVIAGVPVGYGDGGVPLEISDGQDDPEHALRYGVGPGCTNGTETAVPPVRMLETASRGGFGGSDVYSVCNDDFGPALASVAESMLQGLPPSCYPACVADAVPETPQLDYDCAFVSQWQEGGEFRQRFMPLCDGESPPEGEDACVIVRTGDQLGPLCTDEGFNLELSVRRAPGAVLPEDFVLIPMCSHSQDKARDCPDLR